MKSRLLITLLALIVTGCKSTDAPAITQAIDDEAARYHVARTPEQHLESLSRRLELLDRLEQINEPKYETFLANQRLVTWLRIYRWENALGDTTAARAALTRAQVINEHYGLSAMGGVNLLDPNNEALITQRIDALDAGYAGR